jgi:hypothetical protein
MTDLADLRDAYKREVSLPGAFAADFPTISDTQIAAALGDAFGEAQIDGFFSTMALDTDDWSITPDLSTAGAALVVMYAGMRVLRQEIKRLAASAEYKAGPVQYKTGASPQVLTELLKQLDARRKEIIKSAQRGVGTSTFMIEGYASRAASSNFYGGLFPYEVALPRWSV